MPPLPDMLSRVRERIAAACRRSGRDPRDVTLVAVSKTVEPARIRQAVALGQSCFGENRVQEALAKIPEVGEGVAWHLIGHLQRNKARHAVGAFELIHSLDSLALAREIDKRAAARGRVQPVLVQLNLAGEATKQGLSETELFPFLEQALALEHLELRGLMTIPPPVERPEESRPWFCRLRELRDACGERFGSALPDLSMGMTDDFEVAVEEGATLLRVGRAIFGERPPA